MGKVFDSMVKFERVDTERLMTMEVANLFFQSAVEGVRLPGPQGNDVNGASREAKRPRNKLKSNGGLFGMLCG